MSGHHPDDAEWMLWLYGEASDAESIALAAHADHCHRCQSRLSTWRQTMSLLTEHRTEQQRPDTDNRASRTLPSEWAPPGLHAPQAVVPPARNAVPLSRSSVWTRSEFRRGKWNLPRLAVGMLVILLSGIVVGRWTTPEVDSAQIKRELAAELRAEFQHDLTLALNAQLPDPDPDPADLLPLIHDESGRVATATLASWAQRDQLRQNRLEEVLESMLQNQLALRKDLETLAIEAESQIRTTRSELLRLSGSLRTSATERRRGAWQQLSNSY